MTAPSLIRPPRVTTACLFVGLSCAMLLFYVTSTLSNWGSIEVQDQVKQVLAAEPLKSSGLAITDALSWLRWALMAAAAVAVAGIVFAIYTARGHQASRVILTVICGLASLVFLAGGLFGLLPAAFAIGCGIYLWTADSRQWFAVKNGKAILVEKPRVDPFANPGMTGGFETPREAATQPAEGSPAPQAATYVAAPIRGPQPKAVLGAGLVALIMSAMVALVSGMNAVFYAVAPDAYVRLFNDNPLMRDTVSQAGMTAAELARALFIGCSIALIFSLAAIVAAGATLAGKRLGRNVLVGLTVVTVPISIVAFPVGLVWTAGAIATLVLLKRPDSRAWFANASTRPARTTKSVDNPG